MEKGPIGSTHLHQLGFEPERKVHTIPLPDELPPPTALTLGRDASTSAAVENLLSQNEDLMARLKVALRRLAATESENDRLKQQAETALRKANHLEDRVMVRQEQEDGWREKAIQTERENGILKEKVRILEERADAGEAERERHLRFQERVRAQIKPQMLQLREYAKGLEEKLAAAQGETEKKEGLIRDLRQQIGDITKNARLQVEHAELQVHELIDSYESTVISQKRELEAARERLTDLESQAVRLPRAEQRCDELQNELIEQRRQKDDLVNRWSDEARRHSEQTEHLHRETTRLRLENEEFQRHAGEQYEKIRDLEKTVLDQQSQLEGLRHVYVGKCDENDRLKLSMTALERLNVDLSARVQELLEERSASAKSSCPPESPLSANS